MSELAAIKLLRNGQINPGLRFLSHIGQAASRHRGVHEHYCQQTGTCQGPTSRTPT
uniref:Uncharacterized protein n=1 Tax=Candidatus Nitrotoga fabula TaxID=2182327 RepID=A0A2X0QWS4_9PROT|nr:protein of unknown function [Candidatus Nitrotoga fabula]